MARLRWLALIFLAMTAGMVVGTPSMAQTAPFSGEADRAKIESLIATLEDEAARDKLIEQLRLLTQAQQAAKPQSVADGLGARLLSLVSERVAHVSNALAEAGEAIYAAPAVLEWVARQAGDPIARGRWIEIAFKVLVVLGLATAVEIVVIRFLGRFRRRLADQPRNGWGVKTLSILGRTILELLPILVFAVAAYGVLPLTEPREATRLIVLTLVNASVVARAVLALGRVILSPGMARLRPLPLGDETANYAQIWLRRFTNVAVYGYFLAQGLLLIGVPVAIYQILLRVIGLLLAAMAIVVVLQNRAPVGQWLGSGTGGSLARVRAGDVWHLLVILVIALLYLVWAFAVPGGVEFLLRAFVATAVVLLAARLLTVGIDRAVRRGFSLNVELSRRYPGLEARANRHLPTLQRFLTGVVWIFAGLALLEAWGVDSFGWLGSEGGRRITGSLVSILLVLAIVWLAWEILDTTLERYLEERGPDGQTVERSARMRTLLPLIRNVVRVVLVTMGLLVVLSELGLNIGPLLAGAGVVGLAIGFGAQTLVKDVITGFFILIEESISVGDVVALDGHSGVVESMTIRSVRLRDLSGSVHIIPFSSVLTVVNMTKEFAYAMFEIRISYEDDADAAIGVLQQTARDMQQDDTFAPMILAPIEVFGIDGFGDLGVLLRSRMKTRPGKQWSVQREFNRRIKLDLANAGIDMPHHVLPRGMVPARGSFAKA
ncbi:MAG TPA: mechanosensitive ion channel domain-containing protein [Alphaproteobacteria bacterium]|nr:mechanosensitive ion channel domain-containing protein [Alphaproteobacteria bacterium]